MNTIAKLFVVKSKTRYSCASAIYFNLESDVIKANCEFQYYYNQIVTLLGKWSFVCRSSPGWSIIFPCPDFCVQCCEATGA